MAGQAGGEKGGVKESERREGKNFEYMYTMSIVYSMCSISERLLFPKHFEPASPRALSSASVPQQRTRMGGEHL